VDKVDSGQRGYRIERARRATAEYLRCADVRFFRAVIDAHSRAREYAAATPRRSTLHEPAAQTGNVLLLPKKHRRPHLDINAERSPMDLGATRDQPRDDRDDRDDRDCSDPIITIYYIQIKSLFTHAIYTPHRNSSHNTRFLSCISSHLWSSVEMLSATASASATPLCSTSLRSPTKSVI
jgi:hypothetical protein